ncbi:succinylglutamate desuccinylase [Alteromonas facilis]|uniref:succinylglutamate desuccinylase n=1 Tax=Alteromonas facilis TaxID=2048004 RepID=UPI000C28366C|nr:succinylglutamate desuccinylase [Alteromonas facilis]
MDLLHSLRTQGFLALSRQQPDLFQLTTSLSLNDGTQVIVHAEGLIEFMPVYLADLTDSSATKAIVLSCGIHGNETAPIEILDDLVQDLLNGRKQCAHPVLFIFGNLPAMDIGQRFVEENMNRLFSGAHSEGEGAINAERVRARDIEHAVAEFYQKFGKQPTRYHYDLHTAIRASKNEKFAVYPLLHGRKHSRSQLSFLATCGVKTILLSESPTTTFSYFSSTQFNAHAFTVELGKVRPFGQNDMTRFAEAQSALTSLVCDASYQAPEIPLSEMLIYRVNQVINKHQDDFRLHFDDDVANFTDFPKGTVFASESGQEYKAEYDGEAIVFPNANVAIGQRAILTVVPTQLSATDE